jgi:pseudaminic acid synthase
MIYINNNLVGDQSPVYIIAELSANHGGKYDVAARTIEAMQRAGASAVKFQTFTPDSMTLDLESPLFQTRKDTIWAGRKLYNLYREAMLPLEWQPNLMRVATDLGMDCFSSPFDKAGVDFLETMNVPAYKIASLEITDIPLIRHAASKGKPVIISTGAAYLADIERAVNACREEGNNQLILLKCTSAYPTPPEETFLGNIPTLKTTFGTEVGLSDHTTGLTAPVVATALGARVIEKHFILDKSVGGPDASFSLEPHDFRDMVRAVREAEKMVGENRYTVSDKSLKARSSLRSLFVIKDMKLGEEFSHDNVRALRPGAGMLPVHLPEVLGKQATRYIKKGTPLYWNMVAANE